MLLLKAPQMIRFLGSQPLEHPPATPVLGFPGGIGIEGIAAPFDGERQFECVTNHRRFQPALIVVQCGLLLFAKTRFAYSKNSVSAVSLMEAMLCGNLPDEIFYLSRWEFDSAPANITNKVKVIRLLDYRFVARKTFDFQLPDVAGLQKNLERSIYRCQTDPVSLPQQIIPDFLNRGMPF